MKRGDIYFIKSTYREEGSEQRADRPAVIVSNDKNNEFSDTVEVVYMTTQPKSDLPTHVLTRSALKPSTLLCEQITTVSKSRVDGWIGTLSEDEMQTLDVALAISLGLDFSAPAIKEPVKEVEEAQIFGEDKDLWPTIERLQTERDLYKKVYEDLLEVLKAGR